MEYKGPEWTIDPDANYDLAGQVQALPDFNIDSESEDEIASALDAFLAKMNSPYKLMINNLPKNLSKSDLVNFVQKDLNIPSAEINYSPGQPFCYIQFPNLDSCAEAMNIEGESFQGKTLHLKISPSDQGVVVRNFNMRSKNSGGQINKNRFSQLKQERRGGVQQQNRRRTIPENKKHNFPVGGTIRKNRKKNTQKNSMPKTSAWATSGGREQPRSQQSRREPRRGDPTYGDNRNSGRRGGDVRDNQRQSRFSRNDNNNRRDDQSGRDNFSRGDNRRDDQGGRDNNRMNSRRDYGGNRDVQNNRSGRFGRTDRNDRNERNERSGNDRNERSFNDRNERSDRWGNDGPRDVQRGNSGRRDRDPENDNNWRNMGNRMDNQTIKRRQNRAPVTKDPDGFSTSTRAKPVKSIVRENSMNSKKKIAEEKITKQKTRNAFDLLLDEE